MTRGVGGHSPSNVQKHLEGADYPASKNDLMETARQNDAPQEIIDVIERLPKDRFNGPNEVLEAYGEIE